MAGRGWSRETTIIPDDARPVPASMRRRVRRRGGSIKPQRALGARLGPDAAAHRLHRRGAPRSWPRPWPCWRAQGARKKGSNRRGASSAGKPQPISSFTQTTTSCPSTVVFTSDAGFVGVAGELHRVADQVDQRVRQQHRSACQQHAGISRSARRRRALWLPSRTSSMCRSDHARQLHPARAAPARRRHAPVRAMALTIFTESVALFGVMSGSARGERGRRRHRVDCRAPVEPCRPGAAQVVRDASG